MSKSPQETGGFYLQIKRERLIRKTFPFFSSVMILFLRRVLSF